MRVLYSYVVAYDSGFAPNPFNDFCTLATCKPEIRKRANIGDWVIGTGSNRQGVRRGGFLVYAMRVEEALLFEKYWDDRRFLKKRPNLVGSYRMACGDNIYSPKPDGSGWNQLKSYHSQNDGSPSQKHIKRDTSVNRVLVSKEFVYFGAEGPEILKSLQYAGVILKGRNYKKITDDKTIANFEAWFAELRVNGGYQGRPFDMIVEAKKRK